jgi:hypothetical protein
MSVDDQVSEWNSVTQPSLAVSKHYNIKYDVNKEYFWNLWAFLYSCPFFSAHRRASGEMCKGYYHALLASTWENGV